MENHHLEFCVSKPKHLPHPTCEDEEHHPKDCLTREVRTAVQTQVAPGHILPMRLFDRMNLHDEKESS